MLDELLNSMGGEQEPDDLITFELFARCVALLLEENADKVSTSSQQNPDDQMMPDDDQQMPMGYMD